MARKRELERAKIKFLAELDALENSANSSNVSSCVKGIGMARIERKLGLVINVQSDKKKTIDRLLKKLDLDVPVEIRLVEKIKARLESTAENSKSASKKKPGKGKKAASKTASENDEFDLLRNAASRRMGKS